MLPFPGSKRRATNKGASQRVRGKHQKVGDSLRMDEPEVGNNECEDVHENQNEPDLEGKKVLNHADFLKGFTFDLKTRASEHLSHINVHM